LLPYKDPEKAKICQKEYQANNREHIRELARNWYHKNIETEREKKRLKQQATRASKPHRDKCVKYGITEEEYQKKLENQQGRCAICGNPETEMSRWGAPKMLAIDHDHETNVIRDLLCARCNKVLGSVKDDPELLQIMIGYIQKHLIKEEVTVGTNS
jgi:hypothetical protein